MLQNEERYAADEERALTQKGRRVGVRHMLFGFALLLMFLFLISWCSLPGR